MSSSGNVCNIMVCVHLFIKRALVYVFVALMLLHKAHCSGDTSSYGKHNQHNQIYFIHVNYIYRLYFHIAMWWAVLFVLFLKLTNVKHIVVWMNRNSLHSKGVIIIYENRLCRDHMIQVRYFRQNCDVLVRLHIEVFVNSKTLWLTFFTINFSFLTKGAYRP